MQLALVQAQAAADAGEVPVGAVLVCAGQLIASGYNAPIALHDPTAHAEIITLRAAAQQRGNYRLDDCELFVTLEPCSMCAGAMLHARLKRVVFGAADPKTGVAGSVTNLFALAQLNHHTQVHGGVLADASAALLQTFFRQQRALHRQSSSQPGRALRDDALRTPAHCFANLPGMPAPSCHVSTLPELGGLRLHYLDNQASGATQTLLCLHGPQDWCLVWRDVIRQGSADGLRVVCPDLIGFGQSDKPKKESFHTLQWHAQCLLALVEQLNLPHITLLAPESMQGLVSLLLASPTRRMAGIRYIQAAELTAAERAVPFPDAGHQAALRAFATLTNQRLFPIPATPVS